MEKKENTSIPSWKRPFRFLARLIMVLLFIILILLPIYALIEFSDEMSASFDFFGSKLTVPTIIIIVSVIVVPIAVYGLKHSIPMIKGFIKKQDSELTRKPKIAALVIVILGFATFFYYMPFWYLELGIKPQFGPYIAIHGDDGMQISWDTRTLQPSEVKYGISLDNLNLNAEGGEYFWERGQLSYHHCVALEGLVPGQKYYYTIPSLGKEVYSFTAAPSVNSGEKVIFAIQGDTQGAYNVQKLNIALMKQQIGLENLDFTVVVGDNVNRDDSLSDWAMLFDLKSYGGIASTIPYHTTSGNHECSCTNSQCEIRGNFKKFHQNKFVEEFKEDDLWDAACYYSFNYSNVHMVILDNFANKTAGSGFTQRQLDWLDEDLARNKDNWKFLTFHYSMYSTSDHGPYPEIQAQLEPLMYKHKVNAVFYGHDHIFEAYHVNATSTEYGGTYAFMVAGGGGSIKRVTDPKTMGDRHWNGTTNQYGNYIMHANYQSNPAISALSGSQYQLYGEACHHYMKVEVDGNSASFSAYRTTDGSLIQTYSMNLI